MTTEEAKAIILENIDDIADYVKDKAIMDTLKEKLRQRNIAELTTRIARDQAALSELSK